MLPAACMRILRELAEAPHDRDVVQERGRCYCGDRMVATAPVLALIAVSALDVRPWGENGNRMTINSTGEAIVRRPELADEIEQACAARRAFMVSGDYIELLDR